MLQEGGGDRFNDDDSLSEGMSLSFCNSSSEDGLESSSEEGDSPMADDDDEGGSQESDSGEENSNAVDHDWGGILYNADEEESLPEEEEEEICYDSRQEVGLQSDSDLRFNVAGQSETRTPLPVAHDDAYAGPAEDDHNSVHSGSSTVPPLPPPAIPNDAYNGIYQKFLDHKEEGWLGTPMDDDTKHLVKLLRLLRKADTPLYLFDQVVDWAMKAQNDGVLSPRKIHPKRKGLVKQLKTRFNYNGLEPTNTVVKLPNAQVPVMVTTHCVEEAIRSLLTDTELMTDGNLDFFNTDDPFAGPPDMTDDHVFGDVHSGCRVRETFEMLCTVRGRDVLLPIIFFIDKTHIDEHGRLCQEPVCITLGIFNLATRRKPRAWRPIGYIPNQSAHPTAPTPRGKLSDYHVVLRHILKGFSELTRKSGFFWSFEYRGKRIDCVFFPFLLFVVGDTEGHDKLCGRYNCRSDRVACICRYCDTPYSKTDDPSYDFELTKQKDIKKLMDDNDLVGLKKISHHLLTDGNAFDSIEFGAGNEYGANQACPAETLHCIQKGLHCYGKESFLAQKKQIKAQRKALRQSENTPSVTVPTSQDELDKFKVFTPTVVKIVEQVLLIWGALLQQQSDREMPRTYFPQGICGLTKINAHEQEGTLVLFLLLLCSSLGEYWFEDRKEGQSKAKGNRAWLGSLRTADWIWTFEALILLEEFDKCEEVTARENKQLRDYMPLLLDHYKRAVNRTEGNKLCIIKFHLPLHKPDDIEQFAAAPNVDSATGESNHKEISKVTAQRTQLRSNVLDVQSATRYVENVCIDIAHSTMAARDDTSQRRNATILMGNTFVATSSGIFEKSQNKAPPAARATWLDVALQKELEKFFKRTVWPSLEPHTKQLSLRNVCYKDDHVYRADPGWKRSRGLKHGWHDWAYIDWKGDGSVTRPVHLLCYVKVESLAKTIDSNGTKVSCDGEYVVCHAISGEIHPVHHMSDLVSMGDKDVTGRGTNRNFKLYIFPVKRICNTCIVVPNISFKKPTATTNSFQVSKSNFLLLQPTEKWSGIFKKKMDAKVNAKDMDATVDARETDSDDDVSDDDVSDDDVSMDP